MPITIEDPNVDPNVNHHVGGYDDNITPESIQKIRINGEDHPIDAVTLNEKSASDFLNKDGLVTSVNTSSDDEHYPSAKCVYDIIYGSNGGGGSD